MDVVDRESTMADDSPPQPVETIETVDVMTNG
jgi:hypothetical protein